MQGELWVATSGTSISVNVGSAASVAAMEAERRTSTEPGAEVKMRPEKIPPNMQMNNKQQPGLWIPSHHRAQVASRTAESSPCGSAG
jgi:hypothetical protein